MSLDHRDIIDFYIHSLIERSISRAKGYIKKKEEKTEPLLSLDQKDIIDLYPFFNSKIVSQKQNDMNKRREN